MDINTPSFGDEFETLYSEYALVGLIKQTRLLELDNGKWGISFGANAHFTFANISHGISFRVLGSTGLVSWLWATPSHPASSQFTEEMLSAVRELRAHPSTRNVSLFQSDEKLEIDMDEAVLTYLVEANRMLPIEFFGHKACSIASAICRAAAYYRVPTEGGALWLLLMPSGTDFQLELKEGTGTTLNIIRSTFQDLISGSMCPSSHQKAFEGALKYYAFRHTTVPLKDAPDNSRDLALRVLEDLDDAAKAEARDNWKITLVYTNDDPDNVKVTAVFDQADRLRSLVASVSASD